MVSSCARGVCNAGALRCSLASEATLCYKVGDMFKNSVHCNINERAVALLFLESLFRFAGLFC